jgi:hypothetical protein
MRRREKSPAIKLFALLFRSAEPIESKLFCLEENGKSGRAPCPTFFELLYGWEGMAATMNHLAAYFEPPVSGKW